MKKLFLILFMFVFVVSLLLSECITKAAAQAPKAKEQYYLEIHGLQFGYVGYVLAFALGDIINKKSSWLRASVLSSGVVPAVNTMIKYPEKKKNMIFPGSTLGMASFEKGEGVAAPLKGLKVLAGTYAISESFVSLNPNIKTPQDLIGKRFGNEVPTGMSHMFFKWFLEEWGIKDKVKEVIVGDAAAKKDALINRTIDFTSLSFSADVVSGEPQPTPAMLELMASSNIFWVSIDKAVAASLRQKTNLPIYTTHVKEIELSGHKSPAYDGLSYSQGFVCHEEMPDEVVEEICRILWEYADQFRDYHATGKFIRKETIVAQKCPESWYHPAAIKLYKSKGIPKLGSE